MKSQHRLISKIKTHTHIEGYFVSNVVCVADIMPDGRSACDLCKIRMKKIFTLHERMINELMLNKSHKRKINNRLKKGIKRNADTEIA